MLDGASVEIVVEYRGAARSAARAGSLDLRIEGRALPEDVRVGSRMQPRGMNIWRTGGKSWHWRPSR